MSALPPKADIGSRPSNIRTGGQSKAPGLGSRVLAFVCQPKQSIVVMMTVLLNDHDLGIVIAPAIVMAARPPAMKAAIVMAVLRDNNCSILCYV
jgi:hypothetical protein